MRKIDVKNKVSISLPLVVLALKRIVLNSSHFYAELLRIRLSQQSLLNGLRTLSLAFQHRAETASRSMDTILSLPGTGLTELSTNQLTEALTGVDLSGNALTALPTEIGACSSLQELLLHNRKSILKEEIFRLCWSTSTKCEQLEFRKIENRFISFLILPLSRDMAQVHTDTTVCLNENHWMLDDWTHPSLHRFWTLRICQPEYGFKCRLSGKIRLWELFFIEIWLFIALDSWMDLWSARIQTDFFFLGKWHITKMILGILRAKRVENRDVSTVHTPLKKYLRDTVSWKGGRPTGLSHFRAFCLIFRANHCSTCCSSNGNGSYPKITGWRTASKNV